MDQQNSRSWFVDSRHCAERPDGGFELNLYENVELSDNHACYIDDISIAGTMPNVSTNNRLYLFEWTPIWMVLRMGVGLRDSCVKI